MTRPAASTNNELPTIAELAPRLEDGSLSAEDLIADCLARIAADDRAGVGLSAILRLNPEAMGDARRLDQDRMRVGRVRGPLHGVPVVLKDNIDMAGLPTTSGNVAMAGAMPKTDAEQARLLRRAGAVIVAKTNLSEFSFEIRSRSGLGGDVRNPFDPTVTAGGSSGGVAAAIAAGFAFAGLGTDTGGSIRTPAAYNGLVGLRPTHGWLDNRGVAPLAPSTDTVAPMGRSVADVALLLNVMADGKGPAVERPGRPSSLSGARIGVVRQAFGEDPEVREAMQSALALMAAAGAVLVDPLDLPDDLLPIGRPHVVDFEFRPAFDAYLAANFIGGTAPASLAEIVAAGAFLPDYRASMARRLADGGLDSAAYRAVLGFHARLRAGLADLMTRHDLDAMAYPTSAVIPHSMENPAGGWAPELAACSGWPAVTLPVGQARRLIPIGLELLGAAGDEETLLALAAHLEQRLARRYRPDLFKPRH